MRGSDRVCRQKGGIIHLHAACRDTICHFNYTVFIKLGRRFIINAGYIYLFFS